MTRQFATFKLDETLWGIDILQIREIIIQLESYPVPQAPPHVHGLMNLRGQIVTIIDLRQRLRYNAEAEAKAGCCVILKTDGELVKGALGLERIGADAVGLLFSEIGEVLAIEEEQIEPAPAHATAVGGEFIQGVVALDETLMLIMKLAPVLDA
ncbi:chemotaxis protein CheW [Myxococcota bacterium]|nr:chemotaxis protein CheW [Myxococcota bacterium]